MEKSNSLFANNQAQGQKLAGVFNEINSELIDLIQSGRLHPKPLMVCGGGTSSRCAAEGHWTLDLRSQFQEIKFIKESDEIFIGAGVSMKKLLQETSKYNRSFPIGISGSTGVGYILTGGISPLSRKYGLAVDQIKEIHGYWGNGEKFVLHEPTSSSNIEHKYKWKALCGAAPFLAIVTHLKLKTQKLNTLRIWEKTVTSNELAEIIEMAESWPSSSSIYWIWSEKIKVYGVYEFCNQDDNDIFNNLIKTIPGSKDILIYSALNLNQLEKLSSPIDIPNNKFLNIQYSEVLGMLGPKLRKNSTKLIQELETLMLNRPNKFSYIASQQLGGATESYDKGFSSFIHRDSIWKPWVTGSWNAENDESRQRSLKWIEEVWGQLEPFFPGIHLAQMHPHLPFHERELKASFGEWLEELQHLKSKYDPKGILPPL